MTSPQPTAPTTGGPRFTGIIPPVATPMLPDGSVDHASLERLAGWLIEAGVDGLFALGSTGEVAYLTDRQRVEVVATIVAVADGRVPVIAGAIDLTAGRVAEQARALVDAGAGAVVTTGPLYALNDAQEVGDHFRSVAAAVPVPLFAYDVPVRVHSRLPAGLLLELGREGVIAGLKDSSGDDVGFRRLLALNRAAGSPLILLTGHEVMVDAMALAGADGAVPGLANVDPAGYVRLWAAARRGDWEGARAEQERLNEVFGIVFTVAGRSPDATGVGAFKAAMVARGLIDHATMAHPVRALEGEPVEAIRGVLRDVDLLAR